MFLGHFFPLEADTSVKLENYLLFLLNPDHDQNMILTVFDKKVQIMFETMLVKKEMEGQKLQKENCWERKGKLKLTTCPQRIGEEIPCGATSSSSSSSSLSS